MRFRRILLLLFLSVLSFSAWSQDTAININSFEDFREVLFEMKLWKPASGKVNLKTIDINSFQKPGAVDIQENNFFHSRWYLLKLYQDDVGTRKTVFFYPGKMVNVNIYRYDSTRGWILMKKREGFKAISLSSHISLAPLTLKKNTVSYFLIQPELHYYNWTQWTPTLTQPSAINDLILREYMQPNFTYSILTILMAGMMFMLFSYSFLKFYLNKRSEYLFNSLFALAFLLFFAAVFINNFYYQPWWHKYSAFFQSWLQMLGFAFAFIFIIRFLNLRTRKYHLFMVLRTSIIALMVYCCILPFIAFSDVLHRVNVLAFDLIRMILLGIGLYTAVILNKWNRHLSRYVAFGLFSTLFFALMIVLLSTVFREKQYLAMKIGGLIVLYNLGVLTNLFFFRLGLGQKERGEELQKLEDIEKLQLENEKKELEKVLAIASSRVDERNRIAKEIHDDIGSGLTSIRLLSEIALVKNDNKGELNKISANANELVNNLNEIIWSINSKNDTIPNLLAYIRSHMVDYLEPYHIKVSINIPPNIPAIEISGEKRRNIFMVVKECFTNIIKHANATAVNFTVQMRDQLIFTIKDNGKGFDGKNVLPFKNGLRNMKERIEHVGGELDIWGKNGTTITIKIPLNTNNSHL